MFFSEAQMVEEYEFEASRHDYPNAMAAEAAFQHRNGGRCSFDCAACDPYAYDDHDVVAEAAHEASTPEAWALVLEDDLPF